MLILGLSNSGPKIRLFEDFKEGCKSKCYSDKYIYQSSREYLFYTRFFVFGSTLRQCGNPFLVKLNRDDFSGGNPESKIRPVFIPLCFVLELVLDY
jgi:hypothetical protein